MAMSTEEIIIYAALIAFSILCVFAFLTWIISLVCICTQKNVNFPTVAEKAPNDEVSTRSALIDIDKHYVDVNEQTNFYTPSTHNPHLFYLSVHTAWTHGRSTMDQ